LEIEHNRLFYGPHGPLVPPFESIQTRWGTINIAPDLIERYRAFGYNVRFGLPADHLAAELGYMAHLCHLEARASEEAKLEVVQAVAREQNSFLSDHVRTWVGRLARDVRRSSPDSFFADFLEIVRDFVSADATLHMHEVELATGWASHWK